MSNKFTRFLLIFLFMLTTVQLYGQDESDTITVFGKLVEKRIVNDKGTNIFLITIENTKKETEFIAILNKTKVLYGKKEVNIESIKEGSNVTINYSLEAYNSVPKSGKVAVWVYVEDTQNDNNNEDTTELKEEEEEQVPVPADEKEENTSE